MSSAALSPLPSKSQKAEEDLRTAIALNRGIEWLEQIEKRAKATKTDYASLRIVHLEELFHDTHHQLFQDWNGNNDKVSGENRIKLREIIEKVFFSKEKDKDGNPTGLFDENGFALRFKPEEKARDKFAEKLAEFYENIQKMEPKLYSYGNKLTLDFFMVALSKLPTIAHVYPEGIDFRRLDSHDLAAMAASPPQHGDIVKAFKHATDPAIIHPLMNHHLENNQYKVWSDHSEIIGGVPFLSHTQNNVKYLVTMNGGLVDLEKAKKDIENHFKNDGFIADLTFATNKYITSSAKTSDPEKPLQHELDKLRGKEMVSGFTIKDGKAPLVCLDLNIMSGLRAPAHNTLMDFIQRNRDVAGNGYKNGQEIKITALHNDNKKISKEEFLKPWKDRTDNKQLHKMLDIAYDHVNANMKNINAIVAEKFDDKIIHAVPKPQMYTSMGGSGSGKSIVEKIVNAQCGKNYVVSSLDSFREHNDMNTLLLATGHHADDYAIVNPYATELRNQVIDRALRDKVNIYCDGSGIDYKGRNDKYVKRFKEAGFNTQIVAIESSYADAVKRVNSRFNKSNRAMPWIMVADKHINFAPSFLDAVGDRNVDKLSLIATDRGKNEQYLIAETIDMDRNNIKKLNDAGRPKGLTSYMKEILDSVLSIASVFKKIDKKEIADITNIPKFTDENTSFITYPSVRHGTQERVLAVYSASRLTGLMEKGLMNPYANAPEKELLNHTRNELSFFVSTPSKKEGGWQLHIRNQEAREMETAGRG